MEFYHQSFQRRGALKLCLGTILAWSIGRPLSQGADFTEIAESAQRQIWQRFIDRRFDTLLHYSGLAGEITIPSAEHCASAQPNGMSWSTPIEDGPFFGGLYLDGLCNRWHARRDEESAKTAHRIAAGLIHLADLSPTPGFIPRGIGADGKSFYPASSEDQVFPWFYGLWCYLRSGMANESQKAEVTKHLSRTVLAIEQHQWRIPCARPEYGYRGNFTRPTAHDGARLLFLLRSMHELTGEVRWLEQYRERLSEKIGPSQQTRLEICSAGLEYTHKGSEETFIWTHSMSQAALRALADLETDRAVQDALHRGLNASAEKAIPHLDRARKYDRTNNLRFDTDWRFLNASWKAQKNTEEAITLGRSQLSLWAEHNPRSPYEDDTVREPLFAAWIIALAGNREMDQLLSARREQILGSYQWDTMYTASFFIVVNLHFESARPSPAKRR